MNHSKLGLLLMERLQSVIADNPDITDQLTEFVGVTEGTVRRWNSEPNKHPRGETLNRLWYFLEAAGVPSPELSKLPELGGYIGKLMAFGIVTMLKAQEYCGLANEQGVLRVIRGEQTPSKPNATLDKLHTLHEDSLREAIHELRIMLGAKPSSVQFTVGSIPAHPGGEDNELFLIGLSADIGGLYPKLLHIQRLSPEQQARVRELVNPEVLFAVATYLNRLCSTRANIEGGKSLWHQRKSSMLLGCMREGFS